jgi:hypothetical protein
MAVESEPTEKGTKWEKVLEDLRYALRQESVYSAAGMPFGATGAPQLHGEIRRVEAQLKEEREQTS